jgi:hypothetical protein
MPMWGKYCGCVITTTLCVLIQDIACAQSNRGTPEQRAACTPDVFRLCGSEIPDPDRITACLRNNQSLLSDQCSAVFDIGSKTSRETPSTGVTNR